LYWPGHIAWATFLGAPIAGCVLLALNYKRFGDATAATLALIVGLIGTVVLLAIAFVLPDNFPKSVLTATYTFGMFQCAKSLQGDALNHCKETLLSIVLRMAPPRALDGRLPASESYAWPS
jgi:formate-dependent nitrite reductase membrane component NrfD